MPHEAWREIEELPLRLKNDPVVELLRVAALLKMKEADRPFDHEMPDLAAVHVLAARAYSRLGQAEMSRLHLEIALKLKPELLAFADSPVG